MAKKIRRQVSINGIKKWICGNTEQEYAENLIREMGKITGNETCEKKTQKHNFEAYARRWFEVFSSPNVATVTSITYERQCGSTSFPCWVKWILRTFCPLIFNAFSTALTERGKPK